MTNPVKPQPFSDDNADEVLEFHVSASELPIIRIMCPNLRCQAVLAVPALARGKVVKCRSCGTMVRVPIPKGPTRLPAATSSAPQPEANGTGAASAVES